MARYHRAPNLKFLDFVSFVVNQNSFASDNVESLTGLIDSYWPKYKEVLEAWNLMFDKEYRLSQIQELEASGLGPDKPVFRSILDTIRVERWEYLELLKSGDASRLEDNFIGKRNDFYECAKLAIDWLNMHEEFRRAYALLMARKGKGLKPRCMSEEKLHEIFGEHAYLYLLTFCALESVKEALALKLPNSFQSSVAQAYIPKPKVISMAKRLISMLESEGVDESSLTPLREALVCDYSNIDLTKTFPLKRVSSDLLKDRVLDTIGGTLTALFDFSHTTFGRPYVNVSENLLRLCGLEMSVRNLDRRLEKFDQKPLT